jgi:nucleotide-binding universal stress UspA family protein
MKRRIVICAEDTPAAAEAMQFAVDHLYREGDVFHLIYVIKSMKPPLEIHHAAPGTSYTFGQPGGHHEKQVIAAAQAAIEYRYLPILKTKMVPYELHLYADRTDATAKHVGDIILKCCEERDAALVVLAAHNKTDRDRWLGDVGTVAAYVLKNCKRPLAVVQPKGS